MQCAAAARGRETMWLGQRIYLLPAVAYARRNARLPECRKPERSCGAAGRESYPQRRLTSGKFHGLEQSVQSLGKLFQAGNGEVGVMHALGRLDADFVDLVD